MVELLFGQCYDFLYFWCFFEIEGGVQQIDVVVQFFYGQVFVVGYVRYVLDVDFQEEYVFMQDVVVFQVVQQCDWDGGDVVGYEDGGFVYVMWWMCQQVFDERFDGNVVIFDVYVQQYVVGVLGYQQEEGCVVDDQWELVIFGEFEQVGCEEGYVDYQEVVDGYYYGWYVLFLDVVYYYVQ